MPGQAENPEVGEWAAEADLWRSRTQRVAKHSQPSVLSQGFHQLPRQDSNLECLNQNQKCCHYTTG